MEQILPHVGESQRVS